MTDQRAAVVAEAKTWLNTPFADCARVKGAGVDCGQFLAAVYLAAGIISEAAIDPYSPQWHLHHEQERYLEELERNGAHEIPESEVGAGDIVVYRQGRTFSHGAIVIEWPIKIIHAIKLMGGVCFSNPQTDKFLTNRERVFYSFWGKK